MSNVVCTLYDEHQVQGLSFFKNRAQPLTASDAASTLSRALSFLESAQSSIRSIRAPTRRRGYSGAGLVREGARLQGDGQCGRVEIRACRYGSLVWPR